MRIHKNLNLKKYNTFGIESRCAAFVEVVSIDDAKRVLSNNTLPVHVLGGGSNMLLTRDFYYCFFIKNNIRGIREMAIDSSTEVAIEVGAGVNWHDFVLWAIEKNFGGIENLSLIPGTVGAAPIQNIGAYGVELKDVFTHLEALDLKTLDIQTFTKEDCKFGYRDSVFKNELKGRFLITKVFFKLKIKQHVLHTDYGDIAQILTEEHIENPTIRDVSNAIISIRESKLPDPSVIGNAGSFFKNPTIPKVQFDTLKTQFPTIIGYPTADTEGVKVAAGWLIEQCGWKGKRRDRVGVHDRQALVLVNYGGGKGLEIKELAEDIQLSVFEKFGIQLTPEVNFL